MNDDGCCGCGCLLMVILLVGAGLFWFAPVDDWWASVRSLWTEDEWTGFAYPDRNDLTRSTYVGTFDNRYSCLAAASEAAGRHGAYECGLNCRRDEYGLYVCRETVGD
jgi:hypothetical protein